MVAPLYRSRSASPGPVRKEITSGGFSQRSVGLSVVGCWGQKKMCLVSCGEVLQAGHVSGVFWSMKCL